MFCFQHLFSCSAAIALFVGASVAQQFVTYDPAIPNRELASNNCPPAPSMLRARDLRTRGVAPMPVSGAVTADSRYGTLYTTTGFAADGIDAVSFAQIGSGTIDAMELRQVMRHPKVRAAFKMSGDGKDQLTEEEIDAFAAELDKDGDGEISYDEFIAAMNRKEKEANKDFFKLRRSQLGLAGSDVIGTAVKHTETALKASR